MATKKRKPRRRGRVDDDAPVTVASPSSPIEGKGELIMVAHTNAGLRAYGTEVKSIAGADVSALAKMISAEGVGLFPLFGPDEERFGAQSSGVSSATDAESPDLSVYYQVEAPDGRLEDIAERLREFDVVAAAYIKPPGKLPVAPKDTAAADAPPSLMRDHTSRQKYLDAAPGGIDARFAWSVSGGTGGGVGIIDIECAWRFSHRDLQQNQESVVAAGTPSTGIRDRNHGTAVVGVFGADHNGFGVSGICPEAYVRAISVLPNLRGWGSAAAIQTAANMLNRGDIILIEQHRAGPRFDFEQRYGEKGFIPIEWWPDDMDAIKYAVGRGVIVVEAGGNGFEDLDDPLYDSNPTNPNRRFPSSWQNPFSRNPIDPGAIIVGAGAPPPHTHGWDDHGPDRSRLEFSNYGLMFDAQGWGAEVTTTGYGDLAPTLPSEDLWYTDLFNGTSSASAIIVGALGCMQGSLRAARKALLTPAAARDLLRSTGSPQQDAPSRPRKQRIGNRPDLRQMIGILTRPVSR